MPSAQVRYNYYKANYEAINSSLESIDWQNRTEGKTTDEIWDCFADKLYKLSEENIPVCKSDPSKRPSVPWMNQSALVAIRHKKNKQSGRSIPTAKMKETMRST